MRATTIQETIRLWQAEPAKAVGKPAVTGRSEGTEAILEFGSYAWQAALPPSLGGTGAAPSPTALLLSALAGCAVVFIRDTLAPQFGVQVDGVEAVAQCEADSRGLLGMDGAAPDLKGLALTIRITSPAPEDELSRLFQVWRERCPIYLALLRPLEIDTTLEISRS